MTVGHFSIALRRCVAGAFAVSYLWLSMVVLVHYHDLPSFELQIAAPVSQHGPTHASHYAADCPVPWYTASLFAASFTAPSAPAFSRCISDLSPVVVPPPLSRHFHCQPARAPPSMA